MTDTSLYKRLTGEAKEFLEEEAQELAQDNGKDPEDVADSILDKLSDYSIGFIDYMYR